MPDHYKIGARQYFEYLPAPEHRCGDIWINLPTFGLLHKSVLPAIVVTPDCDLSNNKTETITYLPIVPVREYFQTRAALPLIKSKLLGKLRAGKYPELIEWDADGFLFPSIASLTKISNGITSHLNLKPRAAPEIAALQAAFAGCRYLSASTKPSFKDLELLMGPDLDGILQRTITNSFSSSLHFLPQDTLEVPYSAISEHSVVLFRYPITAPIEVLNMAMATSEGSWKSVADQSQKDIPAIVHYKSSQTTAYETLHWTFEQWLQSGSLNDAQRRVLDSDVPTQHPVRILGPAGSGKTLLMQMLAMKHLCAARDQKKEIRVIYIVHNAPMAQSVSDRFRVLGAEDFLTGDKQQLFIATLSEYGRKLIGLSETSVIDKDAQKTKAFQFEQIQIALREALDANVKSVSESPLLSQIKSDNQLFDLFSALVMVEISSVIKGRGLDDDENRYVAADAPLSRLHGILTQKERTVLFNAYSRYHDVVFEEYEMLDSDDVAISLAGRLRTPVWNLKRRSEGFDFVFVDEVQLFNENERRIFPYLTMGNSLHVPIALALDEAQEPFGFSTAGLATLGIADVESEELPSNHRSTKEIVKLAFFVIQRTTDLFGNEFPDFTGLDIGRDQSSGEIALPTLVRCNEEAPSYAKFILRIVQKLRAKNVRQIAVICHAETYWRELEEELRASQLPLHVITQRGEKLAPDQPLVVLSRPAFVGGQEFDAVVLVGLELGIMPPRVQNNPPLSAALEQQVLREIYLAVTRARQSVIVTLNKQASLNAILDEALSAGLLAQGNI